ncbi:Uncharacterized protein Rs2_08702 [Raphanus sativus]|nr:Uncharacterized protein Rs2_08702 [Raphanus sativus]
MSRVHEGTEVISSLCLMDTKKTATIVEEYSATNTWVCRRRREATCGPSQSSREEFRAREQTRTREGKQTSTRAWSPTSSSSGLVPKPPRTVEDKTARKRLRTSQEPIRLSPPQLRFTPPATTILFSKN